MHRLNWLWYVICQKWLITIKLTAFRELQVRQQSFLGQSKNKNNNSQHAQKEQCWRSTAWAFGEAVYRERDLDVTVWFGKSTPSLLSNEHILIGGKLRWKKLEVGETWRCGTSEGHTYCDFEQSATLVPGRNENSQDIFLSLKKSHGWWVFI